jgi:peroxiredoxin
MGAILISITALLAAIAGCAGAAPKPQVGKAGGKSNERVAAKPASSAATQETATPQAEADRDDSQLAAEVKDPAAGAAIVEQPASEADSKQITALRAPTVVPAAMPQVVLSKAHAEDCLIRIGDEFPDYRLPDLMGRMQSLEEMQGDSLTVVVFWSGDRLLAGDQLRYLNEHIARYADLGVKAIAINVGQAPESVRKTAEQLKLEVPILLDLDRGLFSRVGKAHLPRTYLLDRDGSVLWLDIEFSRHTRDGLEQAIHASLDST